MNDQFTKEVFDPLRNVEGMEGDTLPDVGSSDDEMSVMDVTKLMIKTIIGTDEYDKWITYIDDRPFNDTRYHICAKKLKELGWVQNKGKEDLIKFLKH